MLSIFGEISAALFGESTNSRSNLPRSMCVMAIQTLQMSFTIALAIARVCGVPSLLHIDERLGEKGRGLGYGLGIAELT